MRYRNNLDLATNQPIRYKERILVQQESSIT